MEDYPACFVSYAVMRPEVGANPMGHACLLLSIQRAPDMPIQVIDSVGYYGITPCSDTNPITRKLKKLTGLDIDLTGGYGELRHEEMRFLDKGEGLVGITFHLTQLQFYLLRKIISEEMTQQQAAIDEAHAQYVSIRQDDAKLIAQATAELKQRKQPMTKERISQKVCQLAKAHIKPADIYRLEQERAKKTEQASRLHPFEFRLSPSPNTFFTFGNSFTCKNMAVELLKRIQIPSSWLTEIGRSSSAASIPRFSGASTQDLLQLNSRGIVDEHRSKRTGKVYRFRQWHPEMPSTDCAKTTLFFSLPPARIIPNNAYMDASKRFLSTFTTPETAHPALTKLVSQLQKIEAILFNSKNAMAGSSTVLVDAIRTHIQLFEIPQRNQSLTYLAKAVNQTNAFLDNLQTAIQATSDKCFTLKLPDGSMLPEVALSLTAAEKMALATRLSTRFHLPDTEKSSEALYPQSTHGLIR